MTTPKAWEWAESCEPELVTEDHLWKLFGLLSFPEGCNSENAGVTPAALYKSIKESKKELDKLKEINEQQRSDSDYVGLDNLGATCYVNSYLQMWFHTAPFRHLILTYKPVVPTDSEGEQGHDDSIESTIHQMRVLFAQMLLTKKRSLLPDAFIETLGLDPNNQQDAQEFSNLWMGLLQHRFGTAFSRLFCGSCDVSIVCGACNRPSRKPDEFAELILNVPAAEAVPQSQIIENSPGRRQGGTTVNLEDVMRCYFGDEVLDGENAYECSYRDCGKKGRAVRRTRLERAPAILNAQVLRFAFDSVKLQRRKLRTLISFPEHLELRREFFAPNSPELNSPIMPRYRIKAILCHIGTSVVRGHYTARIRLRDGWYIFNDAVVKKGDPTSGGDGGVDADESGTAGGRRFRSADAYCIVYHRVDAPELREDEDLLRDAETLPDDLRAEVSEVEEHFRNELEKKREDIMANSEQKEQLREQRLRIRHRMVLQLPPREDLREPNVQQVRRLLTSQKGGGVVFAHKDFVNDYLSLKTFDDPLKAFGCGEEVRCEHGRLGVEEIGRLKVIPRATAEMISAELGYNVDGGKKLIQFSTDDLCMTCVRLKCFGYYYRARAAELTRDVKVELKQIDNGVGNANRKHWIVRDVAERFGDMAKEAVAQAEKSLEDSLKMLRKTSTSAQSHTLPQIQTEDESNANRTMTADQFFGTQMEEKGFAQTATVTAINGTNEGAAGVRDLPPVALTLKKGNTRYTVIGTISKSSSFSSQPPRNESPNGTGPTPVKRAKMSPCVQDSSSAEKVVKNEHVSISSGDDSQLAINGLCEPSLDERLSTDNDSQYMAAIQASLKENVATIGSPTPSLELPPPDAETNHGVMPEMCQQDVIDSMRKAFRTTVETDVNKGSLCRHEALWMPAGGGGSGRKSRAGVVFGLIRINEELWNRIAAFFPNSFAFCYPDFGVCETCEENANNQREMSDRMREEAKQVAAVLGPLAKRTKRAKVDSALRPLFLVTADFCTRLNDWFTGKTQSFDGDRNIYNQRGLCRHRRLEFLPEELAEDVSSDKGKWVATKGSEWKALKEAGFFPDIEVVLKPVIEKLPKDSTSSGASGSSRSNTWIQANPQTGSILKTMLTSVKQQSRVARISPTSEEQRRLDAEEFKANDISIVMLDSASETATTVDDDDAEELLTDEDQEDEDFVAAPTPKASRGRGRGAKATRGRGRGGKAGGEGAPGKVAKSKRVNWDSVPGVCQTCRQERLDALAIEKSFPEPLVWSGSVYVKMETSNSETLTPPQVPTRRRRRVAQTSRKTAANAGEEVDYVVDSTCPFIEFQMQILDDFEISPLEQILYVWDEGANEPRQIVTPEDQTTTLGQMQVRESQIFILKRKDEDEDEDCVATSVVEVDENNKKAKTNNRAEGFGGTLLSVLANASTMKRPVSPGPSND